MQFIRDIAARFRPPPEPMTPADLPKDQRAAALRDLEQVRLLSERWRIVQRIIQQAEHTGGRLNPLNRVKSQKLDTRLGEVIGRLVEAGVPVVMIEEYANRGSE